MPGDAAKVIRLSTANGSFVVEIRNAWGDCGDTLMDDIQQAALALMAQDPELIKEFGTVEVDREWADLKLETLVIPPDDDKPRGPKLAQ